MNISIQRLSPCKMKYCIVQPFTIIITITMIAIIAATFILKDQIGMVT